MPTKPTLKSVCDTARYELLSGIHLEQADIRDGGDYIVRRREGPHKVCISNSVLAHGAEFTNMVVVFASMTGGPWPGDTVRNYKVKRSGQEGSFFYNDQLLRWYIDFNDYDGRNPSIYLTIDRRSAWWQRLTRTLAVTKRRRDRQRQQRKRMAA